VYCTARIDGASNPSGQADQDVYLKALMAAGSVDHIEYGTYVARVKMAPLATKDSHGRPQLVSPAWPVMIQDGGGAPVTGAVFMVSYANREEKGSDVNVAAHLLLDVHSTGCPVRSASAYVKQSPKLSPAGCRPLPYRRQPLIARSARSASTGTVRSRFEPGALALRNSPQSAPTLTRQGQGTDVHPWRQRTPRP
jgi:hypothetical protein